MLYSSLYLALTIASTHCKMNYLNGESTEDGDFFEQASLVAALMSQYAVKHECKKPRKTSELTGHARVKEVVQGNLTHCYEMFRMEKHIFHKVCTNLVDHGLKPTKRIGVEEMVVMFLLVVGHGVGNRMIQERFQHSREIVSRRFHDVLIACLSLSIEYIKPQYPLSCDS